MGGYGALKPQLLATIAETICNNPAYFTTLTETWGELWRREVQGYRVSHSLQSIRETRGGGIAILHTEKWNQLKATKNEYYVLAAFERRKNGVQEDKIILAAVYIPPVNRRSKQKGYSKILEDLHSKTLQLQLKHNVWPERLLLVGDFNAHLGQMPFGEPRMALQSRNDAGKSWYLTQHYSKCQRMVDSRGLALDGLCSNDQLLILNGQALGDRQGKETFNGPHGCSVLDYAIVHRDTLADMHIEKLDYMCKAYHNALITCIYGGCDRSKSTRQQDRHTHTAPIHLTVEQ